MSVVLVASERGAWRRLKSMSWFLKSAAITLLTLAPPPAVGAVHSRYLRGIDTVALSNGSEYPLGFPEDLVGGAEGGCGNGSLPAEVLAPRSPATARMRRSAACGRPSTCRPRRRRS